MQFNLTESDVIQFNSIWSSPNQLNWILISFNGVSPGSCVVLCCVVLCCVVLQMIWFFGPVPRRRNMPWLKGQRLGFSEAKCLKIWRLNATRGCVTSGGQDGYSCRPPRVRLLGMKSFHLGGVPTPRWVGFESFLLSGLGFRCFRVSGEPPPDLGTDEEIAQLFYRTI